MQKPIDAATSHAPDTGRLHDGAGPARPDGSIPIGQLARESGISLRALRFYQSKGLLKPLRNGKDRLFTGEDREKLELILQGKRLGFTLTEIRAMVRQHPGTGAALIMSRAKCIQQIKHLERQRSEIDSALTELRRIYTGMYADNETYRTGRKTFA